MTSSKCRPGCTCGRHVRSLESRLKQSNTLKLRGGCTSPCSGESDCGCGRHWDRNSEFRQAQSRLMTGREILWADKIADTVRGTYRGLATKGRSINTEGYRVVSGLVNHPLAHHGTLEEHRLILYDKIGLGPHECHWNYLTGCGKTKLHWGNTDRIGGLHVDHLDNDKLNNAPENLVPSCLGCNWQRGNPAFSQRFGEFGAKK